MMIQRKFEIGGLIAAVIVAALFLRGYLIQRDARDTADAFAKSETAKIDVLAQKITASKDQATAYAAGMAKASAAVTTPQQAVRIITQYLPAPTGEGQKQIPSGNDSQVIPIVSANELDADLSASRDASLRAQLPPAPSYAILTAAQTEAIAKNDLACDADRHSLTSCTAQLADSTQISALNQAKAKKYDQALKGGTILQRVGKVLKTTACAAGGAAIGALATRNSSTGIAYGSTAAGAAGGVIACSIF